MAASGYTRQVTANIQPNLDINAEDFNTEFNAIANAFDSTSGHDHTGSVVGDGQKINLTTAVTGVLPTANGGTGSATVTGTGLGVLQTSPTIITPTLTTPTMTTATVSSGGLIITAGGETITAGGLTVSAGGAAITGNSTVTGTLNATAGVSDNGNRVYSPSNTFNTQLGTAVTLTGTSSTSAVMCGANQIFTPAKSTRLMVLISGILTAVTGTGVIDFRYGTGTPPINGAALTGTLVGQYVGTLADNIGFCFPFVITGLTLSTAYWFDLSQKITGGGTVTVSNVNCTILEI